MPRTRLTPRAAVGAAAEGLPDADLVARFVAARDPAAFEALVWRHGPAVRAVCRSILGNAADADDAFQAVFIVLARKAGSVRRPAAVGGWLYGVAVRVARKLKRRLARRSASAEGLTMAAAPAPPPFTADLWPILDEEIGRLPEKHAAVVRLCYVAGLTTTEAAARLGVPKGTVLSRLAAARGRLQARLTRRGVSTGVAVLATAAATASATVIPPDLVRATMRAALELDPAIPAVVPPGADTPLSLSQGVITEMALSKLRIVVGTLALGVVAAAGVGGWAVAGGEGGKTPVVEKKADGPPPPLAADPPVLPPTPAAAATPPVDRIQEILDRLQKQEQVNKELRAELDRLKATPKIEPVLPVVNLPSPVPGVGEGLPTAIPPITPTTAAPLLPTPTDPPPSNFNPISLPTPAVTPTLDPPMPRPTPAEKYGTMTVPKPGGTWYRATADGTYTLTFAADRLTITAELAGAGGKRTTVTVEADYSVSRDGVVFGYITGVDAADAARAADLQTYEEQPFSFRYRAGEQVLTVKDVKLRRPAPSGPMPADAVGIEKILGAGRYVDKKPVPVLPAGRTDKVETPPARPGRP
jgi:RNA polymerase sigma-70 factor (ECF subfamily)